VSRRKRRAEPRTRLQLDSDNSSLRPCAFYGRRHSTQQPTTTDRYDHHIDFRQVFDNLEANGSGARKNHRIVERMDKDGTAGVLFLVEPIEQRCAIIVKNDIRAISAHRIDF
jgi:hypothetical protein